MNRQTESFLEELKNKPEVKSVILFGSHARGNARDDSDVDLLVDFNSTKSLLEKGKVVVELQNLFNREIDLVSRKNVKPSLKPFISFETSVVILCASASLCWASLYFCIA